MIAAAPMLANLFVSLAAVLGLSAVHGLISAQGAWVPLNRRFLIGLRVTMLLFAGRTLVVLTGVGAFRVVELIAAALIPFAVLILTEGLLRRHAPRSVKWAVAAGTVVFAFWALWPTLAEPLRWRGLLAFQLGTLAICGALVLRRDRASLSVAENRAVSRLGLSLLLLVPLAGLDFGGEALGIPVQMSALAVLFLCWLAVGLIRGEAGHGASLWGFGLVIAAAVVVTLVLALVWQMPAEGVLLTGAVVAAAMLALAVIAEARAVRQEAEGISLLRALATGPDDPERFLNALQGHPLVDGAVRIRTADVPDLEPAVLGAMFAKRPVLRRAEAQEGGETEDYAAYLFDRFDASHVMLISESPLEMLALAMPSVAASARAELELVAVQRMALLLARGGR